MPEILETQFRPVIEEVEVEVISPAQAGRVVRQAVRTSVGRTATRRAPARTVARRSSTQRVKRVRTPAHLLRPNPHRDYLAARVARRIEDKLPWTDGNAEDVFFCTWYHDCAEDHLYPGEELYLYRGAEYHLDHDVSEMINSEIEGISDMLSSQETITWEIDHLTLSADPDLLVDAFYAAIEEGEDSMIAVPTLSGGFPVGVANVPAGEVIGRAGVSIEDVLPDVIIADRVLVRDLAAIHDGAPLNPEDYKVVSEERRETVYGPMRVVHIIPA